jgi:hypothetical protein
MKMEEAYFKNIRQVILQEINKAETSIQVAVAWFTNHNLFEKLCKKVKQGLVVEVIIIDDYINNGDFGLDFQYFISIGGKLRYGKLDKPMHHKFAIIDEITLINGSYNWTYYAESRNVENITLTKSNQVLIEQFCSEFNRLANQLPLAKTAVKRSFEELQKFDYFTIKEYLGYDLYFRGKQTSTIKNLEIAARLLPLNTFIQKEYKKKSTISIIKKTTTSLGISSIINGLDNRFSILIPKNSTVPFTNSGQYYTSSDNQTAIRIQTFKGDDPITLNDHLIGSFLISDLPPKPAGQSGITVVFSLSASGVLYVSAKNNLSGSQMEMVYDVEILVF